MFRVLEQPDHRRGELVWLVGNQQVLATPCFDALYANLGRNHGDAASEALQYLDAHATAGVHGNDQHSTLLEEALQVRDVTRDDDAALRRGESSDVGRWTAPNDVELSPWHGS